MSTKSHHHRRRGLKILPIAALLIVTPLLSSSLRLKYLYFIVNILIIAVGAEAGLLSFLLQSADIKEEGFNFHQDHGLISDKPVKACVEERVKEAERLLSLIPNPSIIFIGGGGGDGAVSTAENSIIISRGDEREVLVMEEDYHLDDRHSHVVDDEELFRKAEMFIGNFYKQLKMQKEENKEQVRL